MIILKVFQDNIPRDKKDIVIFKVEKVFLKSQLEEQGYVLIEKSEENNPKPPSTKDILRGIILDYTAKGHNETGFTDELREGTINEIIDTISKPSEGICSTCIEVCRATHYRADCPLYKSKPSVVSVCPHCKKEVLK